MKQNKGIIELRGLDGRSAARWQWWMNAYAGIQSPSIGKGKRENRTASARAGGLQQRAVEPAIEIRRCMACKSPAQERNTMKR
jgi:hypothetical protein